MGLGDKDTAAPGAAWRETKRSGSAGRVAWAAAREALPVEGPAHLGLLFLLPESQAL